LPQTKNILVIYVAAQFSLLLVTHFLPFYGCFKALDYFLAVII